MKKPTTITRQSKAFPFQLKDFDDEKGIVRGYLSTFNNIDEQGDRVLPGAFKRTLQNKYEYKKANNKLYIMPLLWQHDSNSPIGGYKEAKEDEIGLWVELELDLDVQKGKEAYSALKKGYVFQQSIGYDTIKSDYVKVDGSMVRDLVEIRLWEGSIVTFPANTEAVVTDVKSDKPNGRYMDRKDKEKKTVQEHYSQEMCQDLLEDWADIFLSVITKSVLDAIRIGDQPAQDISEAIDDWKALVLAKFVTEAEECDLSGYIAANSDIYSSADYLMRYGSDSKPSYYGYMSNRHNREQKIGKPISADNQKAIDAHVKSMKALAKSAKAAMQEHTNNLHDTADSIRDMAGGSAKAGRAISGSTAQALNALASQVDDHADKAMDTVKEHTKAVRTAADDLATTLQGAEKPYDGDDPGNPDEGQQEGKSKLPASSPNETRGSQTHSSYDTANDDLSLSAALQALKGLNSHS